MPDASGNFKGAGWSRAREDAYTRIFGDAATQAVPREPPREVGDDWRPEDYDQERSAGPRR